MSNRGMLFKALNVENIETEIFKLKKNLKETKDSFGR